MDQISRDEPVADAVQLLRAGVEAGDVAMVEGVLAENVQWFGSGSGACHDRAEVLDVLRRQLESPSRPRLTEVRPIGDGILVRVELPLGDDPERPADWTTALILDADGRIARMQDYEDAAIAEHDLTVLARAGARTVAADRSPVGPVVGLVPFIHVADVARAVAFYELLGLEVRRRYEPDGRLVWAFLDNGSAALMVAGGEERIDPRTQGVLFYLYSGDLAGLREHLLASGILPGEILDGTPGPRHEMRVTDPDGYCLMIAQIDDETAGGRYSTG
ncbi:MAG: VOC family protein [Acidimicrobiales bacterium]